jgi:hypothetical protein
MLFERCRLDNIRPVSITVQSELIRGKIRYPVLFILHFKFHLKKIFIYTDNKEVRY